MASDAAAKYKIGDQVRIRVGVPPTHFRTPEYIQGKLGRPVLMGRRGRL